MMMRVIPSDAATYHIDDKDDALFEITNKGLRIVSAVPEVLEVELLLMMFDWEGEMCVCVWE